MPKGKKKGKYEHKRTEQSYSSDEDAGIDMTNDNFSETSGQSDLKSNHEEAENDLQEKFEEKLMETIDQLSAKSNAARAAALIALRSAMQRKYLAHILSGHRVTLADHVSKVLRRGKDGEKKAAAAIAPILALQIGTEGVEEVVSELRAALAAAAADRTASIEARTECCSSLAVLCYMLEEDLTEILEVMKMYETIFSGSYLKGDGKAKECAAEGEGALHAAALDGWALLVSLLAPAHASDWLARGVGWPRLAGLLHASTLEVRLAAGNALCVWHESACADGEGQEADAAAAGVAPRLEALARESHKYKSKKDRKLQRAGFRDALKYLEGEELPPLSVRLGAEAVAFDTWRSRFAYASLCCALGGSLPALAAHAPALRAALRLPPAAEPAPAPSRKLNKLQRTLQNAALCKARTVARGKSRDKRCAQLSV